MIDFVPFGKIARLSREIIVTEKIDGTNATIYIGEDGEFLTGSRTQWITPERDNHGFAAWAHAKRGPLIHGLGPGWHRGEFWGHGIQRGYGLKEKRFSLFNTTRWVAHGDTPQLIKTQDPRPETWKMQEVAPACVGVVPILYRGPFETSAIMECLARLECGGSLAAPGFKQPEGVVVFHPASGTFFKKTILKDEEPKSRGK